MCRPSGDQTGATSSAQEWLKLLTREPSVAMTNTSGWPAKWQVGQGHQQHRRPQGGIAPGRRRARRSRSPRRARLSAYPAGWAGMATLNLLSVDLVTRTIVVSRNSHCPVIVVQGRAGGVAPPRRAEPAHRHSLTHAAGHHRATHHGRASRRGLYRRGSVGRRADGALDVAAICVRPMQICPLKPVPVAWPMRCWPTPWS